MIRKWLIIALCVCSFQAFALQEDNTLEASSSHYIRDDLYIYIHAGPGRNYRILGSVEAGTPVTVLDSDSDTKYTQIIDDQDRTGWVESKFVTTEMSQSEQLPRLREALQRSELTLQTIEEENRQLREQLNSAQSKVSQLSTVNEQQRIDIIKLKTQVESADKDELVTWFTRGGIVAGAGILLGVMLTYLPKKRNRNKEWM